MSRGLLALLTVAAVGSNLVALFMGGPGAADAAHGMLDRHLERSSGAFSAAVESASWREAAILADAVRVPSAAVSLARGAADQAALDALSAAYAARAEKAGGLSAPGLLAVVTDRGSAESRLGEAPRLSSEASGLPGVGEALAGAPQVTLAKLDGKLFRLALVPGGSGTVAVIGFQLDDAFAKSIGARLSADVTFLDTSGGAQVLGSTLAGSDRTAVAAAGSSGAGKPFSFGPAPAELSFLGMKLPLFATSGIGAIRARSLEVPGVDGSKVVFSTEAVATLAPLAQSQKATLVTTLVLLVVGVALVAFGGGKGGSASGVDDADLATLATQLERLAAGESGVRATEAFPGPLGRIARSANQLASRPAAAAAPAGGISHFEPPAPHPHEDPGAGMFDAPPARAPAPPPPPPPPPPAPPPPARDEWEEMATVAAPSPMAAAAMANSPAWDQPTANLRQPAPAAAPTSGEADFGGMFEAPPAAAADPFAAAMRRGPTPEPEAPAYPEGEGEFNPEATVVAAVPAALLRATSRQEPAKPAGDPDEPHFKQVFQEFQTTREKCGEPADGLTFDKFLVKLKKNREQLVEKYKCRTVRFTVYVKDGKAALKATPVRE